MKLARGHQLALDPKAWCMGWESARAENSVKMEALRGQRGRQVYMGPPSIHKHALFRQAADSNGVYALPSRVLCP